MVFHKPLLLCLLLFLPLFNGCNSNLVGKELEGLTGNLTKFLINNPALHQRPGPCPQTKA